MKKMLALGILVGAFLVVGAAPAMAQTSDGLTPAVETVCDSLAGQLFGLCNAYCEAMDCPSFPHHADDRACAKVLDNFLTASKKIGVLSAPPCLDCYTPCKAKHDAIYVECITKGNPAPECEKKATEIGLECIKKCNEPCKKACYVAYDNGLDKEQLFVCLKACEPLALCDQEKCEAVDCHLSGDPFGEMGKCGLDPKDPKRCTCQKVAPPPTGDPCTDTLECKAYSTCTIKQDDREFKGECGAGGLDPCTCIIRDGCDINGPNPTCIDVPCVNEKFKVIGACGLDPKGLMCGCRLPCDNIGACVFDKPELCAEQCSAKCKATGECAIQADCFKDGCCCTCGRCG